MAYGYDDDSIATQVMLRSYSPGLVGDAYGDAYGDPLSWLGPAIQGVAQVTGAGIAAVGGSKAAKHQAAFAQAQAEAAAAQAAAKAQAEAAATERAKTYALFGAGTLVFLGALGGGLYWWMNR